MPVPLLSRLTWPVSKGRFALATVLITALALGAVWGSAAYWLKVNRGERIEATRETLTRLSEALDDHVDGRLRSAAVILRTVETWLKFHPAADLRQDPEFVQLADSAGAGRLGFAEVRLILADGGSLGPGGRPSLDYTSEAFIAAGLAASPGQLHLGETIRPPNGDRRLLPMALRLSPRSDGVAVPSRGIKPLY